MSGMEIIKKHTRGLAPMEGVTDFPTRVWFRYIGGMDFMWTPFLRVTDTYPASLPERFCPEFSELRGRFKVPTLLQVMGSDPDDVIRTHNLAAHVADFIDLNCGCPSPTVVGNRAGSSLLEKADFFGAFIEKIVTNVGPGRLSVKMRTGFHSDEEFDSLLSVVKGFPLRHLTVHGRTRKQRYTGAANWGLIRQAAEQCPFPVIGSGDICDFNSDRHLSMSNTGIHAVIIGRGALRNPWIFVARSRAPVLSALLLFVVLQDLFLDDAARFIGCVADQSDDRLETGDDFWRLTTIFLNRVGRKPLSPLDVQCSPRALSRGKMIWNYMRSSLPSVYMDPRIMRAGSLRDLLSSIVEISRQSGLNPDNLPIWYQENHDWMYSGQGRAPAGDR